MFVYSKLHFKNCHSYNSSFEHFITVIECLLYKSSKVTLFVIKWILYPYFTACYISTCAGNRRGRQLCIVYLQRVSDELASKVKPLETKYFDWGHSERWSTLQDAPILLYDAFIGHGSVCRIEW